MQSATSTTTVACGGRCRSTSRPGPPSPCFRTWNADGALTRLHNSLREQIRHAEGRHAEPSAAILDSQSVRAAETVATGSRGYDAGKKVNGRKRHIVVDTTGLLLVVVITSAGVQDRHGRPAAAVGPGQLHGVLSPGATA
ncbi:transposase [Micromonospora sp. NPDC023633]|uniref:transposase n=1 Tax=Micromonospora sp. NPDC023633 TaxID=3154320 RepID=UPI0033FC14BE